MIPTKHHVVFATPCFSGTVAFEFMISTLHTAQALAAAGFNAGYIARIGDAYLSKVRNKLVTQFLYEYPNADCLFFLDDDISWPAHKVVEFINRPEDIVAGIYPKKGDELDFPVMLEFDGTTGQPVIKDGLWRAIGVPTGFLRIKRHVLEKMAAESGVFLDGEINGVANYHNIFEMGMGPEGWWWGEDYAFCDKWRKMGGEIWVDPDIEFTHRGAKKWSNNLSQHLDVFRSKALAGAQAKREADAAAAQAPQATQEGAE